MTGQIRRTITQDAMTAFANLPADRFVTEKKGPIRNHHTDPEVAAAMGLSGTVAQALHYCAFISESMTEEFGHDWLEGGQLSMTFLKPVYAGDELTITLNSREGSSSTQRKVECHNQDGLLIAVGEVEAAHGA